MFFIVLTRLEQIAMAHDKVSVKVVGIEGFSGKNAAVKFSTLGRFDVDEELLLVVQEYNGPILIVFESPRKGFGELPGGHENDPDVSASKLGPDPLANLDVLL